MTAPGPLPVSRPGPVAEPPIAEPEEGGDPACWLARVCPACGRIADEDPPTRCPGCGELVERP